MCVVGRLTSVVASLQNKYREDGKRGVSTSGYSQLPETVETQFVKAVSELQSQGLHGGVNAPYIL